MLFPQTQLSDLHVGLFFYNNRCSLPKLKLYKVHKKALYVLVQTVFTQENSTYDETDLFCFSPICMYLNYKLDHLKNLVSSKVNIVFTLVSLVSSSFSDSILIIS